MMLLLNPWWLLSLISLIILLLIYILKPNFQQKFISSTYIWKLSLKYRKKKLPINKLKNILLIICQVCILLLLTALLVKPVKVIKASVDNEVILIIDTSASMRTSYEDESRFERAVELVREKASEVFDNDGIVTVVIAGKTPSFLIERGTVEQRYDIDNKLKEYSSDVENCSYGTASLDDAASYCSDILLDNPNAQIYVYTDVDVAYVNSGTTVINVSKSSEFNVGIINAYSEIVDNYYNFTVELASYGRDLNATLTVDIYGAQTYLNPDGTDIELEESFDLNADQVKTIMFVNSNVNINDLADDENTYYVQLSDNEKVFAYEYVHLSINENDSFDLDDTFEIYGGTKEVLKVLYASDSANPFFNGILLTLKNSLKNRFDIQITEWKKGAAPNEGYDLYIYEHGMMPESAPTDGVVIYSDPLADVAGAGFRLSSSYRDYNRQSMPLTEEEYHPILENVVADNITISRITLTSSIDASYQVLMTVDNVPAILLADEGANKSIVMLFSLHYSNLSIIKDFPILMYNIFDYFLPATLEGNAYQVDDDLTVRSRSTEVTITGNGVNETLETFPSTITLKTPGTYTIFQHTYFDKDIEEKVFVKVPSDESNIFSSLDTIVVPYPQVSADDFYSDPIFWLSCGLAGLLFIEWILKGQDGI